MHPVKKLAEADLRKAYAIAKKEDRQDAVAKAKDAVKAALRQQGRSGSSVRTGRG